jgi:hypothetical protein
MTRSALRHVSKRDGGGGFMILVLSKYADDDDAWWRSASTFLCFVSAVTLYKSFVYRVFCSFFLFMS